MIKEAIAKVVRGKDLTEKESEMAMDEILTGRATPAQTGSFLTALRMKGETVDEITGAARALRMKSRKIQMGNHLVSIDRDEINIEDETILDTSGTGGDGTNTFNISTAAAFVVAGGGVKVAKHGHRAVSSYCGSADVLKALGLNLDINDASVERSIREVGIGFLYAPLFSGALQYAAAPRTEMGIRTIFNLMGPLTNPAGTKAQVLGVYEPELTTKMARVLRRLGTKEAFVVYGEGTLDEISICGPTKISHLKDGSIHTFELTPEDFGLKRANANDISGGNARENASIIRDILDGLEGPRRDVVVLNSAAAFVAAGAEEDLPRGIQRARDAIDSGRAKDKLEAAIAFTQQCDYFLRRELWE